MQRNRKINNLFEKYNTPDPEYIPIDYGQQDLVVNRVWSSSGEFPYYSVTFGKSPEWKPLLSHDKFHELSTHSYH